MHELGELLIRLRGKLSLREAAKRSGLSYSYISSLEKGKHPRTGAPINPTPDILRSLAKAYNYSYDELMKLAGYGEENVVDDAKFTGREKDPLFKELKQMDDKQWEKLRKVVEIIKEE